MAGEEGEEVGEGAPVVEAGMPRGPLLVTEPGLPVADRGGQSGRRGGQAVRPAVVRRQASLGRCSNERKDTSSTCDRKDSRSEEHTSEPPVTNAHLVCRLLLEKTKTYILNTAMASSQRGT